MKFSDRRFLFPLITATATVTTSVAAWAQPPAPAQNPAAAQAEAALRARVEQFFNYQVEKKYRQGEALVANDTKDDYYDGRKFNIKSFTIQSVELLDNNTRAKVVLKSKVTMSMPGLPAADFEVPTNTLWKIENGQWVWYVDHAAEIKTPFGEIKTSPQTAGGPPSISIPTQGKAPDVATLQSLVKLDRSTVSLTAEHREQEVTITNGLPGGADLELSAGHANGFEAKLGKKHLEAGEKTVVRFTATGAEGEKGGGTVRITVSPLGTQLDIRVTKE